MTDFETRLRETLHERAEGATSSASLAAGARGRLRRRRTTVAGVGVLAGVLVIAPFLVNRDEPTSGQIAKDPASPTAIESPAGLRTDEPRTDGLRTESWHDVTFEVPEDWGYGNPSAYCVGGGTPQDRTPSVGRPSDITAKIACDPVSGYGVTIGPPDLYESGSGDVYPYSAIGVDRPRFPDGTWVSIWYDDEVAVTVATPDKALTEQVVGSVRVVEDDGADANGCAPLLGFAESSTADGSDSLSVCRYDESDDLEWSRRVTGADADALLGLATAAPERTTDYDCPTETGLGRFALLDGGAYVATVVTGASCPGNGGVFLLDDADREVTPELAAALERPGP